MFMNENFEKSHKASAHLSIPILTSICNNMGYKSASHKSTYNEWLVVPLCIDLVTFHDFHSYLVYIFHCYLEVISLCHLHVTCIL